MCGRNQSEPRRPIIHVAGLSTGPRTAEGLERIRKARMTTGFAQLKPPSDHDDQGVEG